MQSDYQNSPTGTSNNWVSFIGRNLALLTFLLISFIGMVVVFWYFSPDEASSELSAINNSTANSAPFIKPVASREILQRLAQSPGPLRIGIIAGHKGSDSGAVCADGLTEAEVNENIANQVVAYLQSRDIKTDLLEEFDPRLGSYGGTAVISIHSDSCDYINDLATGYKVAGSSLTDSSALQACVEQTYSQTTNLPYHANTITPHMTDYHVFRTIPVGVPAIIIEVGFMNLDRALLTNTPDIPASGIIQGIECYLAQLP